MSVAYKYDLKELQAGYKKLARAITQTVVQTKGGVGKTSLAFGSGEFGADLLGLNVLFVDQDQRRDLTSQYLAPDEREGKHTVRDIYACDINDSEFKTIAPTRVREYASGGCIDILPGYRDLTFVSKTNDVNMFTRLKDWLDYQKRDYDLIITDNPGDKNALTMNALCAADFFVSPLEMTHEGREGLVQICEEVETVRRFFNPELELLGFLPYAADPTKKYYKKAKEMLIGQGDDKLFLDGWDAQILAKVSVPSARFDKVPIWHFEQEDDGAKAAGDNHKQVFNVMYGKMLEKINSQEF